MNGEKQDVWFPGKDHQNDEHHGVGGSYIVENGVRRLVPGSRTEPAKPAAGESGNTDTTKE